MKAHDLSRRGFLKGLLAAAVAPVAARLAPAAPPPTSYDTAVLRGVLSGYRVEWAYEAPDDLHVYGTDIEQELVGHIAREYARVVDRMILQEARWQSENPKAFRAVRSSRAWSPRS